MKVCGTLQIKQIFASYINPKGNADTERMFRTLKEELLWLREWKNPNELIRAFNEWIKMYNAEYLHSALEYKSPLQVEAEYFAAKTLLMVA
jgi:transposase InsO family protein